jgi:tRNA dimethylallyltransferase
MKAKEAKPKLVVVLGPTSVGKSDFAVRLAEDFRGEIISADSRQVYRGVDMMTGIISEKDQGGIPHHLLHIRSLSDPYSVADFVKDASGCIEQITARKKIPIICGGTAMYIDALVYNQIFPKVAANEKLRAELETKTADELYEILKDLDPVRASTIDTQNPRRLTRAIEIATALGSVPEITHGDSKYDTLIIGLTRPKLELDARIKERIQTRMKQGMLTEAINLHGLGMSYDYMRTFGLEFSLLSDIAEGKKPEDIALQELYFDTVHFAKRQTTWWKRNKDIIWLSPSSHAEAKKLLAEFLK